MYNTSIPSSILVPKIVQVMRLFNRDEINATEICDKETPIESEKWIDCKKNLPSKPDLYYVKNPSGNCIKKAFYIGFLIYAPKDCCWYHITEYRYISNSSIGWWMPLLKSQRKDE